MAASVIAHQGGWDEFMLVALPILVIGALLYLADRRARRGLDRNDEAGDATNATSDDDTPSSSAGGAGQGSS